MRGETENMKNDGTKAVSRTNMCCMRSGVGWWRGGEEEGDEEASERGFWCFFFFSLKRQVLFLFFKRAYYPECLGSNMSSA